MIEKIAEHHNLWLKMAMDLGIPSLYREDIVQDMYVKLYEQMISKDLNIIFDNGDINKFYVFLTIKSMRGQRNRSNRLNVTSLDAVLNENTNYTYKDSLMSEEADLDKEVAFELLYKKVINVLNKVSEHKDYPQYLKTKVPQFMNLFMGYNGTDKSMRQISRETGIRLGTIHQTLNKVMDIVRAEVGEDVADYFYGDYNLIK